MGKDLCIMGSANYFMMLLVSIPAIFIATTAHEFTRAAVSSALGDNYPKSQGRLTLNPFKHFEPIGFLLLLYSGGFGWGRPVDTSALYYKQKTRYAADGNTALGGESGAWGDIPMAVSLGICRNGAWRIFFCRNISEHSLPV